MNHLYNGILYNSKKKQAIKLQKDTEETEVILKVKEANLYTE